MSLKSKLYLFEVIILVAILSLEYIFINNINYINIFIITIFPLITYIMYKTLGMQLANKRIKKIITQITVILILLFVIISNLSGLIFGFSKNPIIVNASSIFNNIYGLVILITCEELMRYMISKKCYGNEKSHLFIITALFIVLDIFYITRNEEITSSYVFFISLTTLIIPSIARNIISTYLSYHVSYVPGIILRLFFAVYPYIFPIYPNYGNYVISLIGVLIPFILYLATKKSISNYEKTKIIAKVDKKMWFIIVPIWVVIISLFILIPGFFKYQIIAIGSGSMEPKISYGDAVIFEKNINVNELKEGEVIVFLHDNDLIVHRINSIDEEKGIIKTKGDANATVDSFDLTENDIKGKVRLKIKFIGYPTILIGKIFK